MATWCTSHMRSCPAVRSVAQLERKETFTISIRNSAARREVFVFRKWRERVNERSMSFAKLLLRFLRSGMRHRREGAREPRRVVAVRDGNRKSALLKNEQQVFRGECVQSGRKRSVECGRKCLRGDISEVRIVGSAGVEFSAGKTRSSPRKTPKAQRMRSSTFCLERASRSSAGRNVSKDLRAREKNLLRPAILLLLFASLRKTRGDYEVERLSLTVA